MKFKGVLIVLFFIQLMPSQAQIHFDMEKINTDSLHQVLPGLDGIEKVDALNKLSLALLIDNPDSSISLAERSVTLSEELDYQKGMADGLFNLGNSYYILDEFKLTINNYLKALRIYEDLPPSNEYGILCLQVADMNFFTGRFKESLPYYRRALTTFDKLDHQVGKIRSAWLVAYTHWMRGNFDSSHYYTHRGMSFISPDGDPNDRARLYMHFARTYRQQFIESGDTSLLDTTIQWLNQANDLQGLNCNSKATIIYNLGSYSFDYNANDKNKQVVEFFKKAIPLAENCKEVNFYIPMVYRRLGEISHRQGNLDSALILLEKALGLIEQELSAFNIKDYINPVRGYESRFFLKIYKSYTLEDLYLVYLKKGDYQQALDHYILWKKAQEERYLETNKNLIALLEAKSQDEKTKSQITALAKENEIKELKINQSRILLFGLAGLMVILLLVGLLFLRQNKLKNEHKTVVLEQKLLRLQMNPHFIFNALSNIMSFIEENNNNSAINYLSKFSKLLRTTLESSREEYILLEQEIEGLRNYLELQKLRFEDKFEYEFTVDDKLDPEEVTIPPMLIQPFIENAIEHGVRHKETTGHINVRFMLMNKKVVCEVEDDGVGREKAWETEYQVRKGHKSLATEIIKDRIHAINRKMKQKIKLEIIDLKSEAMEAMGTKVVIDLPLH